MGPAELLACGKVGGVASVAFFWDSDIAVLLIVGDVLMGTTDMLSLPLLDRAEVVNVGPLGREIFVESAVFDSTPWVVIMPVNKETNKQTESNTPVPYTNPEFSLNQVFFFF